jgi:YggT family protein
MGLTLYIINIVFQACIVLVFIRAILPWFPHNRYDPMVSWIYSLTDPILGPIKNGLPPTRMGMDFSPFIAILGLWLLQKLVMNVLFYIYTGYFPDIPGGHVFPLGNA